MANRNFPNSRMYTGHVMPVLLDCNFIVDSTSPTGIKSLKGPFVKNVFMKTSATPASGNAVTQDGLIVVQLQDNFNRVFSCPVAQAISPNSGSDVKIDNSAMTAGQAYVITTLGNATAAKWHAIGVPAGITPAAGVSFIAATNGGAGNVLTSMVQTAAAAGSGVCTIELVGNPTATSSPSPSANQGFGAQAIMQARDYAGAVVAPVDGSTISLAMYLSNSSITVAGE